LPIANAEAGASGAASRCAALVPGAQPASSESREVENALGCALAIGVAFCPVCAYKGLALGGKADLTPPRVSAEVPRAAAIRFAASSGEEARAASSRSPAGTAVPVSGRGWWFLFRPGPRVKAYVRILSGCFRAPIYQR
jgi:hypothetical protein